MLDEKDLEAISQLMDSKLAQQKQEIGQEMQTMRQEIGQEMQTMRQEILAESNRNMNALLENMVIPQLQLLAEGQQIILETLAPKSRVDALEEEMKFMKVLYRQMNEDIQQLKKAN